MDRTHDFIRALTVIEQHNALGDGLPFAEGAAGTDVQIVVLETGSGSSRLSKSRVSRVIVSNSPSHGSLARTHWPVWGPGYQVLPPLVDLTPSLTRVLYATTSSGSTSGCRWLVLHSAP